MIRMRNGMCLAILGLVTCPMLLPAQGVQHDRVLTSEVTAYFTVNRFDRLKAEWNSLVDDLRQDEAIAELLDATLKAMRTSFEPTEEAIGVKLDDLWKLPSGQSTVALLQPEEGTPVVVALFDFGDSRAAVDTLLERAANAIAEQGGERDLDEFEDTQIVTLKFPGRAAGGQKLTYAIKDSTFVVATSDEALKRILARWSGESQDGLADNETYQYIIEKCRTEGPALLTWYLNPIKLATGAITSASGGSNSPQAAMFIGLMPTLGLNDFRGIGGVYSGKGGPFSSVNRTFLYVDQPTTGILNIMQFPADDLKPPSWVSQTAAAYISVNWDVELAYSAVSKLFDAFQGPGALARLLDVMANNPRGPGLHVKKDLVDQLSGRFDFVLDIADTTSLDNQKFLLALGIKDAAVVRGSLDRLTKADGFPGKLRDFQGTQIIEFPGATGLDGQPTTIGLSVAHGRLLLASHPTLMEHVLRGGSNVTPLAETDDYLRMAEHIPDRTSIVTYQRQDAQLEAIYEMVRKDGGTNVIPGVDLSRLPPFDNIRRFLRPAASYAVPDPNGALLVGFSLAD